MDFHPVQQTFLLVGTDVGHVGLWEVISGAKLFSSKFSVQKTTTKSTTFLEALLKDPHVSVNRILWSPDGSLFGVAYSKHIVQLYSYHGGSNIRKQLEIDAHVGGVNDLAFSRPNGELLVITCGDDKLIQVWDVTTGAKQYTFQGHEAPVYSVCAHVKERIHFLFSMSTNGEIKAWLYDNLGSRVTNEAPGHCCARMAYSADGKRLFSCGTTKDGESYFVEWDVSEGCVKRTYQGLQNCSSDVVQFDTSNNRFLAAGDDHLIKIWDMDHVGLLTIIDADGGLPASPYVRFNTKGTFLAVFADHNRIKILANDDGLQLLQTSEYNSDNAHGVLSEILRKLANNPIPTATGAGVTDEGVLLDGDSSNSVDENPELAAEPDDILEVKNFSEVNKPSQCQSLRLPSEVKTNKILRLIYTNAGNAILALASNGSHLLWKWSKDETNLSGKVTTKVLPQLWQPRSGLLMTNDFTGINFEEVLSCLSLSKNDSYVVSASGGRISLFNMLSFKTMKSFMPPPPAATCIAFYPQDNNIIAVGMDDSTILIYYIRVDKVISILKGHSKRITGLAFSNVLDVLVSSGVDAQVVVWDTTVWKKKKSRLLRPSERLPLVVPSNTHVQFHHDQIHFLAVHETHIAIYETTKLECLKQWAIGPFCARISHATFSCDSQLIYASFLDGTVLIFSASDLLLQCEINPTAYLPSDISSSIHPLVVAAHPQKPNQFALGLTDGGVVIFEPLESEGKWGVMASVDDGSMNRMPMVFPLGCFKGDA
ncbi:hypothetical protein F0562_012277 [Nyssa sinensis]|uniref:Anaphase-promoting complex subunit 4 WD40 domain-containing protein n=1 Tax=Nyssa sinensis TaxID=561372 RepID=A0A5J4ZUP1_9ASTE|nr:hypothetical protein F0562_012277 [Nyssa sinensis]